MPSILPDFEYDIFISYRHNDNRSGAITELVNHLREELAATIKAPLSIYFDTNPYDGLLENHDVDRSLAVKLKSLIFIPILSQTYCDSESFAWRNEFCAFNEFAREDSLGMDVKLNNGNIASRILPIKIHELDREDIHQVETATGRTLRAIDFIFKSAGVNRPLQMDDRREDNDNNLYYRDQVNKVANAAKELLNGIRFPDRVHLPVKEDSAIPESDPASNEIAHNSIAILPFRNLSQDPSQEYFADGITENILIELAGTKDMKVISRTSVLRYKNSQKTAPEIARELNVKYILEGSAQSHGNKLRITTQLIDAVNDNPVWSRVFTETIDDLFEIQAKVAETVVHEIRGPLGKKEVDKPHAAPTANLEAYDLFLKGRHAFNQWSVDGYRTASEYFRKAIEVDPDFTLAYSYLASSYSARMSWNGDLAPDEALKNIMPNLEVSWNKNRNDNDYLTRAYVEFFVNKDFEKAEEYLLGGMKLGTNNVGLNYTYSYLLNMMGRHEEALQQVDIARKSDPLTVANFNFASLCYYFAGDFDRAIETIHEGQKLYPAVIRFYDFLARFYLAKDDYSEAKRSIETGLSRSGLRPPSMVAYLGISQINLSENEKAGKLINELEERSENGEKGVNYYLIHLYHAIGDENKAQERLKKAIATNDIDLIWLNVDPLLKGLVKPENTGGEGPDFEGAEAAVIRMLEENLPPLPYHNIDHLRDVLSSALEIAKAESISAYETKLLRMAVILHDTGFIDHTKGHEARSVEFANQILPEYGFDRQAIEVIEGMILATRIPQQPTNQLEKIICDADLDYLGREDFWSISQTLYKEYLQQGTVHSEREWNLVQRTFFESHRYHTEHGKSNRSALKQKYLEEIIEKLSVNT